MLLMKAAGAVKWCMCTRSCSFEACSGSAIRSTPDRTLIVDAQTPNHLTTQNDKI
jgi:hypothetical protein